MIKVWFFKKSISFLCVLALFSCKENTKYLDYALKTADNNKNELEKVIAHYSQTKNDSLKLKAAIFLIENMPGHYSYAEEDILKYYKEATPVLASDLPMETKKEKIGKIAARYPHVSANTVQDIEIITSDYLIKNIDYAFRLWQKPWAKHLDFEQFCEYLLPYKCFELQQLDHWKDTLLAKFTNDLEALPYNDDNSETVFHISQTIIRKLKQTLNPSVNIVDKSNPFQSASTCYKMPYGTYRDYNNLVVAVLRSFGIAGFIENLPQWGRNHAAHTWCSLLNDHGQVMPSQWGIYSDFSSYFFPIESIPKVFRQSYSINKQTEEYFRKTRYKHNTFSVFNKDVTDEYMATSDLSIAVFSRKLKDDYVYIALFDSNGWNVVDYGILKKGHAQFKKMGRNVLYLILGLSDAGLTAISHPFILDRGGKTEFLIADTSNTQGVILKRIYPKSYHITNFHVDENNVYPGHAYELKYWNSKAWCSLGIKTAEDDYLIYDNVPQNSLLWLSNLTQERKERVFTYKDNKQIWW